MKKWNYVLLLILGTQFSCKNTVLNKRSPLVDTVRASDDDESAVYRISKDRISKITCADETSACDISNAKSTTVAEFLEALRVHLGIADLAAGVNAANEDIRKQEGIADALRKEQAQADEAVNTVERLETDLETLDKEIADIQQQIALIDQQIQKQGSSQPLVEARADYQSQLNDRTGLRKINEKKITDLNVLLNRQDERALELQSAFAQKTSSEKRSKDLSSQVATKESEVKAAEESLREYGNDQDYSADELKDMPWFGEVFKLALETK
ncbi:MAG: hypothetical protein AB7T49_03920 [Oligoflexales bacterium]